MLYFVKITFIGVLIISSGDKNSVRTDIDVAPYISENSDSAFETAQISENLRNILFKT